MQPAGTPDSDVLLRLLLCVRGATHVRERDRWAGRRDVAVGLVGGCSHGETVQQKGNEDEHSNDVSGKCSKGEAGIRMRSGRIELEQALAYYRVAALREPGAAVETVLSDFLTDLRHYCARMHQDLAALERTAQLNYVNETN